MAITLKMAIANYRAERKRLVGGPYPHLACSCGFCDVVRAADLLYAKIQATHLPRRWRAPVPREAGFRRCH